MRVITKRDRIRGVPALWEQQYGTQGNWGNDKTITLEKLKALGIETATEDEIERIIGNSSWTALRCHECNQEVQVVIELGEEPDYESATANICPTCLKKATKLLRALTA